jgi:phosphate acetyltransferase
VRKKRPDLKIEGPIQYDAAVDMEVGKVKCQIQRLGQASVLIFPDLNTGNNTYKAVQRETGALAIG